MESPSTKTIALSTITFLVGIIVSAGTAFGFMEGRIEKRVRETVRLTQLEVEVKAQKEAAWVQNKAQSAVVSDLQRRLSLVETRVSNNHSE